MLQIQTVALAGTEALAEYQYQVIEVQGSEVGLAVPRSQKFDCKTDALWVKYQLEQEGNEFGPSNPHDFRLAIHVTRKED